MDDTTRARSIGVLLAAFGLLAAAYATFAGGGVHALLGTVLALGGGLLTA